MSSQPEHWYLRKDDGSEYGPVSLGRLRQWAAECRLTPGNRVSRDRDDWIPVEQLAALEMDWMARRPDGREYGPFTIRAVPELFNHGILPPDAELRNERTAETVGVSQALARLQASGPREATPAPTPGQDEPDSSLGNTPDDHAVAPETGVASTDADTPVAHPDVASDEAMPAQATDEQAALRATIASREAECASLRAALEEQATQRSREREEQVRERETLEAESTRMEAGLQATIATLQSGQTRYRQEAEKLRDELDAMAHQVSFMKKNNASLLHDLDGRARLVRRLGRAFAVAVLLVAALLTGWLHCLVRSGRARQDADIPVANNVPVARPVVPAPPAASPAAAPPATVATPVGPRPPPRPAIAWPAIRVEGVTVRQADNRQSLIFEEPVFSRLTELSDWGRSTLLAVARELAPRLDRFRLIVEGHTDNVPLSSTSVFESNTHLGQLRADAVAALLTESGALPPDALRATSRGDRSPPYPNDSAANRRRNRTVVLHLEPLDRPQDRVAPAPVPVL